uniref:DUF4283 domain-containing protein n=1 Tax=Chenopodium quinoa TaxID=63459 RepID=A0A803NET4_CHEQI
MEGLLRQYTTTFDGRLINLRRYDATLIPQQINFSTSRIWVRVYGLPLPFLTEAWARRIFVHLGYLDQLEPITNGRLPQIAELRALMVIDMTQPLIPGFYIPIEGGRVIWVYFRRLSRRLEAVERDGLRVLHGPLDYPYYTNFIREESNDTVYFTGSDSSSSSGVEDGNSREVRIGPQAVRHSPGRRLGLRQDPYVEYTVPNLNTPPSPSDLGLNTFSNLGNIPRATSPNYSPIRTGFQPYRVVARSSDNAFFSPPPPTVPQFGGSTFEVGESSSAAAHRVVGENNPRTLFQVLRIDGWEANAPLGAATGLLQDVPNHQLGGRRLVQSLSLSRARRVFPDRARALFLPDSPNSFGREFQKLPMTEFDPPNSPVSQPRSFDVNEIDPPNTPVSQPVSFDVNGLFQEQNESRSLGKRPRDIERSPANSWDDENVRASSYDLGWIEKKRLKTLHRWADKGGFNI